MRQDQLDKNYKRALEYYISYRECNYELPESFKYTLDDNNNIIHWGYSPIRKPSNDDLLKIRYKKLQRFSDIRLQLYYKVTCEYYLTGGDVFFETNFSKKVEFDVDNKNRIYISKWYKVIPKPTNKMLFNISGKELLKFMNDKVKKNKGWRKDEPLVIGSL